LGKKRKIISSTTHQLSFNTRPLTVLLTPPNSSPTGSGGKENGTGGAADFFGTRAESRLLTGEATGGGAGGHGAGGNAL